MYQVSEAFRQAMAEHKAQRILLEFRDRSFSNEHISIDDGVSYSSVYNANHDMTIGECNSALVSFDLFNEDHSLDDFAFGRFSAWIGVETSTMSSTENYSLVRTNDTLVCTADGLQSTYALMPLGVFIAPRPSQVAKQTIHVEAYDQMILFDRDMPTGEQLGVTYPVTAADLLRKMCQHVGVEMVSYDFINAGIQLASEPESFDGMTMRDVIGQIAEAAGSNARMDRDGRLEFVWFNQTNLRFDEHGYTAFTPTVYEVAQIDKLTVRNSDSTKEAVVGGGTNAYLVQNNAFLRQDDSTKPVPESRARAAATPADNVYNRLASAPVFHPADVELFADPMLEAGDVVTISSDGKDYLVPVYSLDLKWNGDTMTTVQATGDETRQPLPALQRKMYGAAGSGYRRLKKQQDSDGYIVQTVASAIVGDAEDPVAALLQITRDGFLQTVASQSMKSLFVQTYKGFKLIGEEIVLDGNVIANSLESEEVYVADMHVANNLSAGETTLGTTEVNGVLTAEGVKCTGTIEMGSNDFSPHTLSVGGNTWTILGTSDINFKIADTQEYQDGVSAAYRQGYEDGSEGGGEVVPGDIQIGNYQWYDSNSTADLSSYTTLTNLGTLIQQHKDGRGYVTFRTTVKGTVKNYKIPIG